MPGIAFIAACGEGTEDMLQFNLLNQKPIFTFAHRTPPPSPMQELAQRREGVCGGGGRGGEKESQGTKGSDQMLNARCLNFV